MSDEAKKSYCDPLFQPVIIPNDMGDHNSGHDAGMSLRDYFAGMALQVITKNISLDDFVRLKPQELAEGAYKIADAMIERRKR